MADGELDIMIFTVTDRAEYEEWLLHEGTG